MNQPAAPTSQRRLALFQGFGVELEYMVVDADDLTVLPIVDRLLEATAGRIVSEVEMGPLAWSNELVLHVVELKTNGPAPKLEGLDSFFQKDVLDIHRILSGMGGRLLPTAMHPWMDPTAETVLWPHEFSRVYESYDRIFGCQGHGWSNLQSTHLNLPFSSDEEFGRLHAAIRLLLPFIPALAASSPLVEGRPTGLLDNRMEFYRNNSRRIPSVTGAVIPEPIFTQESYQREIMGRMFADIAPLDPDGILRHEFLNSRGALPRFERGSIEIRVIDVQECPSADLALAALVVGGIRLLTEEVLSPVACQQGVPLEPLASAFLTGLRHGEATTIADRRVLRSLGMKESRASVEELWWHLLEAAERAGFLPGPEEQSRARALLRRGSLSRQILRALDIPADHVGRAGPPLPRGWLAEVYRSLADCLRDGLLFVV